MLVFPRQIYEPYVSLTRPSHHECEKTMIATSFSNDILRMKLLFVAVKHTLVNPAYIILTRFTLQDSKRSLSPKDNKNKTIMLFSSLLVVR